MIEKVHPTNGTWVIFIGLPRKHEVVQGDIEVEGTYVFKKWRTVKVGGGDEPVV